MKKFYLATSNLDKLREFQEILPYQIELIKIDLEEIQAIVVEDIITHKAVEAYRKTKKSVLVEDTGIYFFAWNNFPGALYKWLDKTLGNDHLCKIFKEKDRRATAVTLVGFYDGRTTRIFKGEIFGRIAQRPRGQFGFGFDEIFIPNGYNKTFAQMLPQEKNAISMRRLALNNLKKHLKNI